MCAAMVINDDIIIIIINVAIAYSVFSYVGLIECFQICILRVNSQFLTRFYSFTFFF